MLPRFAAPKRAIVIGGGIAGASIMRDLTRRGVGVTLLEKAGQLCAGATWHAAGLVTRFGGSPKIKKVHVRALREMVELHQTHDVGMHITGSIRLLEKGNADRLTEAKQHVAMAALYDDPELPTTLISAEEVAALHPLVDVSNVEAGVFTPLDGDVDPTLLTTCIAKLAKEEGASIVFNAEVETIAKRADGRFEVVTATGERYEADAVVNAAGLWSRRFSRQLGLEQHHPAFVIEHHYAVTETIAALKGKVGDGERVPVLRDLAGSTYIRQERDGLLVGPYEGLLSPLEPTVVKTEWEEGPPSRFAFDLFPPALDRLEGCLLSAMEVVPALETVGFKSIVNGPTIWTGDSLARCGRTRLPGYYDFNSLTYGVAQSLALSEYLGHIITEGEQPYDMATEFDPLRYGGWATPEYTAAKVIETYSHNNSVSYPHENRPAGRDAVAKSDAHAALQAALAARGALFAFSNAGIEVPVAFLPEGVDAASLEQRTFARHAWAPYAEAEAQHLLSAVGLGFASFSKLAVRSGPSDAASRLLERASTNTLPKRAGRTRLTYAPTEAGHILAEFTVTRVGVDRDGTHDFYLCASRDYALHDLAWLEQQRALMETAGLLEPGAVELRDLTNEIEILHLAGPSAPALMAALCPEAATVPFLQMRPLEVCGVDARVFRISFTGEAGYELHVAAEDAAPLFEAIMAHPSARALDCRPFGGAAVNSLRIEKGFKIKADLDYAHWAEAGVGQFIPMPQRKNELLPFVGREAPPPAARLAAIFDVATDAAHAWSVAGDSPVRDADGRVVGFTTTSARGAITGRTIALGYVRRDAEGAPLALPGDGGLTLECYGHQWPVELLERPPVEVGGKPTPAETEPLAASG